MTILVRNTQSRDQSTDSSYPIWTVGDNNQTRCYLSPLNDYTHSLCPAPWNILHVTQGVLCSSLNRKFISCDKKHSFIHRKTVLWHKVLFFLFLSQEINFLSQEFSYFHTRKSSCDRFYTPFVTGVILPVAGRFSCDMGISSHVTGNVLPI